MPIGTPTEDISGMVVDALRTPGAYPHPVSHVHIVQTHASTVFLTGDFAYKVKKPIRTDFLDYSTLDRRGFCCQEEVRLNSPLCPDVYLGVAPVSLRDGKIRIDGDGEVVDWAVRMRQLREDDIVSNRLSAGRIGHVDIERITQAIAEFHLSPFRDAMDTDGSMDEIASTTFGACDLMDQLAGDEPNSRFLLRPYLEEYMAIHADLLIERMRSDKIRDCHGDLRTQNICLDKRYGNGVQIFDCIEFNSDLRFIDVAADLAYLAMDLDLAGRADLRQTLVTAYCRATLDTSLPDLLTFYKVYRAIVRGNIALLAAAEREIPVAERDRHFRTGQAAFDLARCYASGGNRPSLFITVGYAGSGKSTLAYELSRRLPAVLISSDAVRRNVSPRADDPYSDANRSHVYDEMRHLAISDLTRGDNAVLDATFLSLDEQRRAATVAASLGADFWIIECRCPHKTIRERLRARDAQRYRVSDADVKVFEQQLAQHPDLRLDVRVDGPHRSMLSVDTSQPVDITAREVVNAYLSRR